MTSGAPRPAPVVAVVPARAGSRGLAGKNLRTVDGQTLVERAVRAARGAGIGRVVVSTDGDDIAGESERLGCTTVIRPAELAGDTSRTIDAVLHVARELELSPDTWVVLLQPTSPLRRPEDVQAALARHAAGGIGTTLTACAVEHHPLKELLVDEDGVARPVRGWSDLEAPRQTLPLALRPNGAVYVTAVADLVRTGSVIVPPVAVVEMPDDLSLDVDDLATLERARSVVAGRRPV